MNICFFILNSNTYNVLNHFPPLPFIVLNPGIYPLPLPLPAPLPMPGGGVDPSSLPAAAAAYYSLAGFLMV